MDINLFEQASRQKLRFASERGELMVEQLWDLPLTSKNGFDLDTLAREVNRQLRLLSEESFVETKRAPATEILELKLEILKHIIAVRIAEREKNLAAVARSAERQRLLEILGKKEDAALEALTPEQIKARLDALG